MFECELHPGLVDIVNLHIVSSVSHFSLDFSSPEQPAVSLTASLALPVAY